MELGICFFFQAEDGIRDESVTGVQIGRAQSELQSHSHLVCRLIRSEEHTSELQSHSHLVCRLLLEKKKNDARRRPVRRVDGRRLLGPPRSQASFAPDSSNHLGVASDSCIYEHVFFFYFFLNDRAPPEFPPLPPPAAFPT